MFAIPSQIERQEIHEIIIQFTELLLVHEIVIRHQNYCPVKEIVVRLRNYCLLSHGASALQRLFHSYRFRQVAWLIDVAAASYRDVVCEQLQRYDFQDRKQ